MAFWIIVAALAAGVTLAITRPLMRPAEQDCASDAPDLAVYKDQLREVEVEAARGVLTTADAESARLEISRRLLRSRAAPASGQPVPGGEERGPRAWLYALTSAMLPLASLLVYIGFGSPGLPGDPLADRISAKVDVAKPNDLVAKVEARLREHPDDGTGWDVIAPVYYAMGRYQDAATAFRNALNLVGESVPRLQGFADSRIRVENGIVPDDAEQALQRIVALDPKRNEPKIWLGIAKEQDGRLAEAIADYRKLVAAAPPEARWRAMLEERVGRLEQALRDGSAPPPVASGATSNIQAPPSDGQIAAMSPAERKAFIERMVDGLATRLKADGRDAMGWQRLIRAYEVLGRRDDAVKALNDARAGLKDDSQGLAQVEGLAKRLGLGG